MIHSSSQRTDLLGGGVMATSMNDDDQILRAYAAITSIRANVPERHEVEERWVNEFNAAIEKLEKSLGIDLQEFKVPHDALKRFVASCNSLTNDVTYLKGLWCERAILMQKLDWYWCTSRACKTEKISRSVFDHLNSKDWERCLAFCLASPLST